MFFKACFPNIYKRNNHIAWYNFCYQYKDFFAISKVKRLNYIFFAASLLKDCISIRWQKLKHKLDNKSMVSPFCDKFKAFLQGLWQFENFSGYFLESKQIRHTIPAGKLLKLGCLSKIFVDHTPRVLSRYCL